MKTSDLNLPNQKRFHKYYLPIISKKSSARIGGPLSMAFPDPLNTRPIKQGVALTMLREYLNY